MKELVRSHQGSRYDRKAQEQRTNLEVHKSLTNFVWDESDFKNRRYLTRSTLRITIRTLSRTIHTVTTLFQNIP